MDFIHIQIAALRQLKKGQQPIYIGYQDGQYGLSLENCKLHFIPEEQFFLDGQKIAGEKGFVNMDYLLKEAEKTVPVIRTNQRIVVEPKPADKRKAPETAAVFQNGAVQMYVNAAFLSAFPDTVQYRSLPEKATSPVYIYENDLLLGLILPYRPGVFANKKEDINHESN